MTLTPEQFNKLVTKDYLAEVLSEKIEKVATKEDVNAILNAVDGIAKRHNDFEAELASNQGAHDRMDERMNNHDARIKRLELKNV